MKKSAVALFFVISSLLCACNKETEGTDRVKSYTSTQAKSPKRGVAFNFGQLPQTDIPLLGPAVSWSYNWSSVSPSSEVLNLFAQYGMDWCPMIWNGNWSADNIRAYKRAVPSAEYILAFNEPNLTDQANMTPSQAAELWPEVKAIANELGMKIISPAMNYGTLADYHDPWKWLDEFFACDGVSLDDIDGIAVHCYMGSTAAVKNYIAGFKKYGKPIWLTEFCNWDGNSISEDTQLAYMCETLNYLESDPDVERYAWFIPRGNYNSRVHYNLLTASQPFELTTLGKVFVNFSSQDQKLRYGLGAVIPAEHYNSCAGAVHCAPSSDETGILELTNLKSGGSVSYNLSLDKAATQLELRSSTYMDSKIDIQVDGTSLGTYTLPNSSSEWKTLTLGVSVPAGEHTLTLAGGSGAAITLNYLILN